MVKFSSEVYGFSVIGVGRGIALSKSLVAIGTSSIAD
jgi:hypothetical protein